ncbi:MAG: hypothetical protein HWE13_06925 [Gammaproteobacteria bacterium]|nr:hypothetical protein [Gammaproteobacteria bacterium]NVK87841.1 hypothetical protein [Gammaproteobacteria bacterium]
MNKLKVQSITALPESYVTSIQNRNSGSTVGFPDWMMQLLGATEIAQGDLRILGRQIPQRLDTVEEMLSMLDVTPPASSGSD